MEFRKLINFGKSSFVVSLPKAWVGNVGLKKGDMVYIDEQGDKLILSPKESEEKNQAKEAVIDVSDMNSLLLKRTIIPAYINNYDTIVLKGKDLSKKSEQIKKIIHNVMALEVMEETADKIVAKDFINMKEINVNDIVRRMDIITRSMIDESLKSLTTEDVSALQERDEDVNRLSFLVYRGVRFLLQDSRMATEQKLTPLALLNLYNVATHIEKLADDCKRIARLYPSIKGNKKAVEGIRKLHEEIAPLYREVMKAYYTQDTALALEVSAKKDEMIKQGQALLKENLRVVYFPTIAAKAADMIFCCHYIARTVYS